MSSDLWVKPGNSPTQSSAQRIRFFVSGNCNGQYVAVFFSRPRFRFSFERGERAV